jgi:hypothetical protein
MSKYKIFMSPERTIVPTLGNTGLEYVTYDVMVTKVKGLHYTYFSFIHHFLQ